MLRNFVSHFEKDTDVCIVSAAQNVGCDLFCCVFFAKVRKSKNYNMDKSSKIISATVKNFV